MARPPGLLNSVPRGVHPGGSAAHLILGKIELLQGEGEGHPRQVAQLGAHDRVVRQQGTGGQRRRGGTPGTGRREAANNQRASWRKTRIEELGGGKG
jgi:hypothetical protein